MTAEKATAASICAFLAVLLDVWFMYCLYRISLCIPSPNQQNWQTKHRSKLQTTNINFFDKHIKVLYPQYFFKPKTIQNNDDESGNNNDLTTISNSRCCSMNRIPSYILSLFNIICGLLFIILQIAFTINMIFQFLVACWIHSIHGIILFIGFMISILILSAFKWGLNHSLNATLLLWNNIANVFDTSIQ